MIKTLLIALSSLMITGCAGLFCDKKICPQKDYAPKFDTTQFKYKDNIEVNYWVDRVDENTTLVIQKDIEFYYFVEEVKTLKADYNILLNAINKFNKELNVTK